MLYIYYVRCYIRRYIRRYMMYSACSASWPKIKFQLPACAPVRPDSGTTDTMSAESKHPNYSQHSHGHQKQVRLHISSQVYLRLNYFHLG